MYNNSSRGEALIDVIIGATLIGWFAVTMYGTVISLVKLSGTAAKRIQGVWIANSYMEELLGLPFTDEDDTEDDLDDLDDFSDYETQVVDDYGFRVRTKAEGVEVDVEAGEVALLELYPPFTRVTVTVDGGGLSDGEELVLQTLTPGAVPDEVELEAGQEFLNLSVPADHMIFDYRFESSGGRDLDTRTKIISPIASKNLGWAQDGNYNCCSQLGMETLFKHGGDNTGYGYESVYLDVAQLREDNPGAKRVDIECAAAWYGSPVSGDVNLTVMAYVGGSHVKTGYQWAVNSPDEETGDIVFDTKTTMRRSGNKSCDLLANITYDWKQGILRCLLPGSTPDDPKPCTKS